MRGYRCEDAETIVVEGRGTREEYNLTKFMRSNQGTLIHQKPVVKLGDKVSEGTVIGQYDRYNMARVVSVTANIQGGDLGSVAAQVEKALASIPPPAGVNVALRGQVQPLMEMQAGLRLGLLTAVAVIFLLLVANFQSVRLALAGSPLDEPITVTAVFRPPWLEAVAAETGVAHGTISEGLTRYGAV